MLENDTTKIIPGDSGQGARELHVVFVITRSDVIGGAQVHVRDMAARLLADGHRATVLVGGQGPLLREFDLLNIEWIRVPPLAQPIDIKKDTMSLFFILRMLRRLRPDIVSTHTAKAGMLGRLASAALSIPVIFTAHGWSMNPDRLGNARARLFRLFESLGGRFSDGIINVCRFEYDLALRHGVAPQDRLFIVHNGIKDSTCYQSDPKRTPPRIVMVARMEHPKDHGSLLYALSRLLHFEWTLDLVGEGPLMPQVRSLVRQLGLAGRVVFSGDCGWDVRERLGQAQIFALTTRSEGFPRCILEAMRAGLPVIASDVAGIGEAIQEGVTGYLISRGDSESLAARLETLVISPELRATMGENGRRRYQSLFTFDLMYKKTVACYESVLDRRDGRPKYRLHNPTTRTLHH